MKSSDTVKNILLEGRPGSGKTTLVKKLIERLSGHDAGGFYTEEIRESGERTGFRIRTLDGRDAVLAHVDFSFAERVGKYSVDVRAFEALAVPVLKQAALERDLVIIDEIGRMELFSDSFKTAVRACFFSDVPVVATIMSRAHPFADGIKMRRDVKRMQVTKEEQGFLVVEILEELGFVGK